MKKKTASAMTLAALIAAAAAVTVTGCGKSDKAAETASESNKLYVYNWGEYIDEDVKDMFQEETGIEVVYDVFAVSYTHLDVYKRQTHRGRPGPPGWTCCLRPTATAGLKNRSLPGFHFPPFCSRITSGAPRANRYRRRV